MKAKSIKACKPAAVPKPPKSSEMGYPPLGKAKGGTKGQGRRKA